MNRIDPVARDYVDASAAVEYVLRLREGKRSSRRLTQVRPLFLLPMCHAAADHLLDNRFRQARPPTEWHEYGSAVKHLNEALFKGTDLILLPLAPVNLKESRREAETLATTHQLEKVDALQLQQLKRAFDLDPLGTLLTVSDNIEQAATREGLRVRNACAIWDSNDVPIGTTGPCE